MLNFAIWNFEKISQLFKKSYLYWKTSVRFKCDLTCIHANDLRFGSVGRTKCLKFGVEITIISKLNYRINLNVSHLGMTWSSTFLSCMFYFSAIKGVDVVIWYLSITSQNNSRAVVENLRILVCWSSLTITNLIW